jgi:hypothetical protein
MNPPDSPFNPVGIVSLSPVLDRRGRGAAVLRWEPAPKSRAYPERVVSSALGKRPR